jgi:dethiobiotin synthetase
VPGSYVITGTDTGIGKTIVAAGLAGALGAAYWKPVQAGLQGPTDSDVVAELGGKGLKGIVPETYRLTTPCSPHEAASLDGISIRSRDFALPLIRGPLIVEGAGGLMVPINDDELMIDLFAGWSLPIILVARTALGTINHSLLSIKALRSAGLELAGIVFVGNANPSSEAAIIRLGTMRHLGRLPWLDPLSAKTLQAAVEANLRLDLLA